MNPIPTFANTLVVVIAPGVAILVGCGITLSEFMPGTETAKQIARIKLVPPIGKIELIITQHALDRLNDMGRFATPPRLPMDEEVRVLHLRRLDNREDVWMCKAVGQR